MIAFRLAIRFDSRKRGRWYGETATRWYTVPTRSYWSSRFERDHFLLSSPIFENARGIANSKRIRRSSRCADRSPPPLPPLPPLDASGLITPNHIFLHSDRVFDTVIEISDIEILKTRSEENFGRSSEIDNNASWSSCVTRSNETRSAFYVTLFIDERSSFKWPIVDSRCVDNKFSIKILYFSGYFCMR